MIVFDPSGGSARLRSSSTLPAPGIPLRSTIVIASGTVTFAEPSCCVFVSFLSVTVYASSVTPAGSCAGTTFIVNGLFGAAAAGDAASAVSNTATQKTRNRNGTVAYLRVVRGAPSATLPPRAAQVKFSKLNGVRPR